MTGAPSLLADRGLSLPGMTDLLERAVRAARKLPPAVQDDIARMVLIYAGEEPPVIELAPKEEASLAESLAQAARALGQVWPVRG